MKRNRATEIACRRVLIDFRPKELIQHLSGMIFSVGGPERGGLPDLLMRQNLGRKVQSARRTAESASTAIACSVLRNFLLWPLKSPSAVKLAMVATAPANLSVRGRMIATWGRLGLMNSHGTGKIR